MRKRQCENRRTPEAIPLASTALGVLLDLVEEIGKVGHYGVRGWLRPKDRSGKLRIPATRPSLRYPRFLRWLFIQNSSTTSRHNWMGTRPSASAVLSGSRKAPGLTQPSFSRSVPSRR